MGGYPRLRVPGQKVNKKGRIQHRPPPGVVNGDETFTVTSPNYEGNEIAIFETKASFKYRNI